MATQRREQGFEVFARHDSEPALHHVGQVQATDVTDAVVFAYTLYDERKWQDMLLVPSTALIRVIRPA